MNPAPSPCSVTPRALAVVALFFCLAAVILYAARYTRPTAPDETYWNERRKNLAELQAREAAELQTYGWVRRELGVVRLPIARAMDLTLQEWRQPEAARSNLLARVQAAYPPVAPAAAPAATSTPAVNLPKAP